MTRKIETITPLDGEVFKVYTCGLTVYSQPHIGNWAYFIFCDTLHRSLLLTKYKVERVQNITDVGHLVSDDDNGEDKMEKGARREGKTAWDIAAKYIEIASVEAEKLRLLEPNKLLRATDFIEQQIEFIKTLEKKGYTYLIDDGVYFDTSRLSDYGKLAKLDIKGLDAGARVAMRGKKNSTDFALWKLSPKQQKRDMEWESPWGKGFPGWHLECSVIARESLGDSIDIHTGGIDHIPIHHTNEIAQTESLTGKPFSKVWVHANHIKSDGKKMSKSLGNIYTLQDLEKKGYSLAAFRLLVLSRHYQTEGNFSFKILDAAQSRLNNWHEVADLFWQLPASPIQGDVLIAFAHNNLDTPHLISEIDSIFEEIKKSRQAPSKELIRMIDSLLGINLMADDITDEQKKLMSDRNEARKNKNWQLSDKLRDELLSQDIYVNDMQDGTFWHKARN